MHCENRQSGRWIFDSSNAVSGCVEVRADVVVERHRHLHGALRLGDEQGRIVAVGESDDLQPGHRRRAGEAVIGNALKNFLDYNWEECAGKLFGYIVSSHEKGLTVMDQMRTVVRQCYGWSMPYGVSFHGRTDLDANGSVVNPRIESRVKMMARDLVTYGTLLHRQFAVDLAGNEASTFAAAYRE